MARAVDLVVISDVHLGTPGCKAAELNAYLKSVAPARLVLCGDMIDFWEFRKGWWPTAHTKVVRRILKTATAGVPVHYITGNHDEALRRYAPFALGDLQLGDELELELGGERTWFTHGDCADRCIGTSRLLTWLGCQAYDRLADATDRINWLRRQCGLAPVRNPSCRFKATWAAGHIQRFERAMAGLAAERGFDAVVCGHIHHAQQRVIDGVAYRNGGDWVDSLSALEWHQGEWRTVRYHELVATGQVEAPRDLGDTASLPVPAAGEAA